MKAMEVELEVQKKFLSLPDEAIAILLKDKAGEREMPMMVNIPASVVIAAHLEDFALSRPHAYDIIKSVITGLGAEIVRVEFTDFDAGGIWRARLCLREKEREAAENPPSPPKDGFWDFYKREIKDRNLAFPCKSGDGIAVALVCGVPIVVWEEPFSRAIEDPRVKSTIKFIKKRLAAPDSAAPDSEREFLDVLERAVLEHPEDFEDGTDRLKLN